MEQNLLILLWGMSGALIGGVVTPILSEHKRVNDWLAMVAGVVVGLVGNFVLLIPLWGLLSLQRAQPRSVEPWQADAISANEARRRADASVTPVAALQQSLWPAPRADAAHSHRMSYVAVFVVLAIVTAVEVAITYIDLPFSPVAPLVALSTAKVLLVVMYFMHLRFDSPWYSAFFALSAPFAAMVLIVLAVAG